MAAAMQPRQRPLGQPIGHFPQWGGLLSPQELQIAQMAAEGLSNRERSYATPSGFGGANTPGTGQIGGHRAMRSNLGVKDKAMSARGRTDTIRQVTKSSITIQSGGRPVSL
jgi:hypothetical protein